MSPRRLKQTHKLSLPTLDPRFIAGLFGVFSSLVLFALSNSYNSDSIIYLHTADVFSTSGWKAAQAVYDRPFYSAIIGTFSNITHLSTVVSAQIISALLVGLTGFAFVHLLSSLGANSKTMMIGAIIICIYPGIANYKDYFIRDFGYWSFLLLTLSFFVSHYRNEKSIDFILWVLFGVLATLFRPEAFALILALFASSFTFSMVERKTKHNLIKQYLTALTLTIAGAALLTTEFFDSLYAFAINDPEKTLTRLAESWSRISNTLESEILNRHSREFSDLSLVAIYATIYISQVINGLSLPFASGLIYFAIKRQLNLPQLKLIAVAIVTVVLVTTTFLISTQFIQTRYLIFLCLLLLVPFTFSLSKQIDKLSPKARTSLIVIAALLFLDAHISFGHSKKYIADSIQWVQANTENDVFIISNDPQISYLSGKQYDFRLSNKLRGEKEFSTTKIPDSYDIIAWKSEKGRQPQPSFTINQTTYTRIVFFSNSRDDRVSIYQKTTL